MRTRTGFLLSFFLISHVHFSQSLFLGIKLSAALGSHQHYYGLGLHSGFCYQGFMVNVGCDVSYRLLDLGQRKNFLDSRSYFGASWITGKKTQMPDFELGTLNQYFDRTMSIGYAFIHYGDRAGTSQNSGAFRGEIVGHSLYLENDFFAGQGKDRFRTASLLYRYRQAFWSAHLGLNLWTGEASGLATLETDIMGKKIHYKDLSKNPYGKTSHGILLGGVTYGLMYQTLGVETGIDSERIRNAFQNRLAHSTRWHKKDRFKAVIYPMLDSKGLPTFDKEQVRKDKAYFRFSISGN